MCRLFATQDPAGYACETRAIRLHGHVTSVRLEAAFWTTLEEIATLEGMPLPRFLVTLHDEIVARHGDIPNFASLLRVTCVRFLSDRQAHAAEIAARRSEVPVAA